MNFIEEPNYISYSNPETGFFQTQTKYGIDDIEELGITFKKKVSDFQAEFSTSFLGFGRETDADESDLKQERSNAQLTLAPIESDENTDSQSENLNLATKESIENVCSQNLNGLISEDSSPYARAPSEKEVIQVERATKSEDSNLDDPLQTIQAIAMETCNYLIEVDKTSTSVLIKVKPSNIIFEHLDSYLRGTYLKGKKKARSRASSKKTKRKKLQKTVTFNQKNFSKKLGDQFCNYLWDEAKVNCNSKFKDKMSWKLLNNYLTGEKVLKGFSPRALMMAYVKFMQGYDVHSIDESKTNEMSKIYYKICAKSMNVAFQEIEKFRGENFGQVIVRKGYPEAIIEYFLDTDSMCSE